MCWVRPGEGLGAVAGVWRTLESLKRLEAVEADPVQAGEARHEAQRPGVQTEDVSPEAEAETGPGYVRSSVKISLVSSSWPQT